MIVIVDFDETLALGNLSKITKRVPNKKLIKRLQEIKSSVNPIIKVVTARGSRYNLTEEEKKKIYYKDIHDWLVQHDVPFDFISFNKEYGSLYIDDMTITPYEAFEGMTSSFTKNKIIFTKNTVIKHTKSAKAEFEWYKHAKDVVVTPNVLFCNDELLITERINNCVKPKATHVISLIHTYKDKTIPNFDFSTYQRNIDYITGSSRKTLETIASLKKHEGTFFHGDLSTTNILIDKYDTYCIDSNYKQVFGSYLTDAAKAYFSFIAYEKNYSEAEKIAAEFGKEVINFAVAEGLRVCKYQPKYISIVNNIADLI